MLTRRSFVSKLPLGVSLGVAGVAGGLAVAPRVLAGLGAGPCRFLFVNAEGGWDPLCVFAPMFDAGGIEMEPGAEPWTAGGLPLVDHPLRPVTRGFFERHHGEVALLNGVSTRSVNHETCAIVAMTGSTSEDRPDWGTILGYAEREGSSLPHLVVSGPSFPGPYSVFVSHAQGMLQATIDGTIHTVNDAPLPVPQAPTSRVIDRFLERRGRARAQQSSGDEEAPRLADYREALARARALTDASLELQLVSGEDFGGRLQTAVSALAAGVCRCASVGTGFVWDTHADNAEQTGLFEGFFGDLGALVDSLAVTLGPDGEPLSSSTIVVVTSEMARTPAFNGTGGRDHWPYTSMMLMGPGVNGGRTFGGYSSLYTGIGVDAGGDADPSAAPLSTEALGASLLVLGDVDPAEYLRSGATAIPGLLA